MGKYMSPIGGQWDDERGRLFVALHRGMSHTIVGCRLPISDPGGYLHARHVPVFGWRKVNRAYFHNYSTAKICVWSQHRGGKELGVFPQPRGQADLTPSRSIVNNSDLPTAQSMDRNGLCGTADWPAAVVCAQP